jgi:hypothetical protein
LSQEVKSSEVSQEIRSPGVQEGYLYKELLLISWSLDLLFPDLLFHVTP